MTDERMLDTRRPQLLVVGGNSNAAKAFRRHIAEQGHFRLRTLSRENLEQFADEELILVQDYFTPRPDSLQNVDAVINFAGLVKADQEQLHKVNAIGPTMLATIARGANVRHFVQISSLSVYGGAEDIDEATVPEPHSAYGKSKLAGDTMLSALGSPVFAVTSLRVPILYSKSAKGKLHRLAQAMSRLQFFPVPSVLQPRSVLHLDNLAAAIEAILYEPRSGVRFAADPEPFTVARLADGLMRQTGRRPKLVTLPRWVFTLLRSLSGNIYTSLYGRSLVARHILVDIDAKLTPQQCIDDIVLSSPYQ